MESEAPSQGNVGASNEEILPGHGGTSTSQMSLNVKPSDGTLYNVSEETAEEYDKLRRIFIILLAAAGVSGLLATFLLIGYHIDKAKQGTGGFVYTWDKGSNLHQIIMMTYGVIMQGIAINIYRYFPFTSDRHTVKLIHFGLNVLVGTGMIVGFLSIYFMKDSQGFGHFLTQHGWAGIISISCFLAQLVGGSIFFLVPIWPIEIRTAVIPFHKAAGWVIYLVSCITALMAFNNKLIAGFSKRYLNEQELLARFAFLFCLFQVTIMLYLAIAPQFRRRPRPE